MISIAQFIKKNSFEIVIIWYRIVWYKFTTLRYFNSDESSSVIDVASHQSLIKDFSESKHLRAVNLYHNAISY